MKKIIILFIVYKDDFNETNILLFIHPINVVYKHKF